MSGLRTSLPVPTQPWEAARARFLEGLSEEESKRFKDATLENVFYDASAAQKMHAQKSRSWLMQQRLSSLIDSAADYGKALDVYSNTYGLIVCPIWGSLRVILHIAHEAGKFQEKLVEMLAQIGDVLPRFRIYQALFRDHERLLVALSAAYLDVLRFCVRTKDFFKRAKQSMIPLSIVLKGAWKSFRLSFEESMSNFRMHSKTIEKEANLAHMIESARRHEIELANRALQIRNQKLAKRHRILSTVPSVDYQSKLARLSNQRHPGTTRWINQTPQFISWSTSTNSDCLCIYGIPGSGKSVLAASVVDALQESTLQDATSLVCYYVFDYTDLASLEPLRLVGSLIQQVLQSLPLDTFEESFQCPFIEGQSWPAHSICVNYLLELLKRFQNIWFVLDAIDEPNSEAQTVVLNAISQLLGVSSIVVRVLVTSRVEDYLIRNTLKSHKSLKIMQKEIANDISLYIDEQIRSTLLICNPLLENERLRQEVIDRLTKNAKGMFLWVRFQLYNLTEVLTETELEAVLRDLPRDLHETYSRIIEKVENGPGGQSKIAMMQKLFRWVAVARRPLKLQELEEAAGLEKTDTHLHTNRTASESGRRLIGYCGNLLVYNEEDDTVTFAHHTIRQFLYAEPRSLLYQASLSSITCAIRFLTKLELTLAHIEIGELCLAYLDFTDFETQIVHTPKGLNLKKDEAERLVWMGVPLAAPIKGLLSWIQTRRSSSTIRNDCEVAYTMPAVTRPSESLVQKYNMLDYITTFWVFHTAHLTPDSSTWSKFERIALHRALAFEHRPWNDHVHRLRVEKVLRNLQELIDLASNRRLYRAAPGLDWIGNDMLMYSWAVKHGIGPPLRFVNLEGLLPYLELIEISPEKSRAWPFGRRMILKNELESFLSMDFMGAFAHKGPNGFWNAHFILDIPGHLDGSKNKLMDFVKHQHSQWVGESEASMKSMIHQAIPLAADNYLAFDCLLDHYSPTWDDLTSTLKDLVRNERLNVHILQSLVGLSVIGRCTPEVEWQLVFVLHECFPIVARLLPQQEQQISTNTVFVWTILSLLIYVHHRPLLIYHIHHWIANLNDPGLQLHVENLPNIDWRLYTFGSEQVYRAVLGSNRASMLREMTSISNIVSLLHEGKELNFWSGDFLKRYSEDETLQSDINLFFKAEEFETDGIHLLELALFKEEEHRQQDLAEAIVPKYWAFVRDKQHKPELLRIVCRVEMYSFSALCKLVPLLPPALLHQTIDLLHISHGRLDDKQRYRRDRLLTNTTHLNQSDARDFIETWKMLCNEWSHDKDAWIPILLDAMKEWRRIVEEEW